VSLAPSHSQHQLLSQAQKSHMPQQQHPRYSKLCVADNKAAQLLVTSACSEAQGNSADCAREL
jgi:hypothetical protein